MDLKQLEYIVQIAQEGNITKAAEKLYITQSALTQHLLKIEKELGFPLFYRSRTNFRMTEVGEAYVASAREMLHIRRETYNRIGDIARTKRGTLSVAFTPGHGTPMFASAYPLFHQRYPEVMVTPLELSVRQQQSLISGGEIDIGFMTLLDFQKTGDRYIDICEEEIVLAIPRSHPLAKQCDPYKEQELSRFCEDPFILMFQQSTLRPFIDQIFQSAGFEPRVLFETHNTTTIVTMIQAGLCCSIIPYYHIRNSLGQIAFFHLPGRPTWKIAASYKKGSYLSDAAQQFIHLASDYWRSVL